MGEGACGWIPGVVFPAEDGGGGGRGSRTPLEGLKDESRFCAEDLRRIAGRAGSGAIPESTMGYTGALLVVTVMGHERSGVRPYY